MITPPSLSVSPTRVPTASLERTRTEDSTPEPTASASETPAAAADGPSDGDDGLSPAALAALLALGVGAVVALVVVLRRGRGPSQGGPEGTGPAEGGSADQPAEPSR